MIICSFLETIIEKCLLTFALKVIESHVIVLSYSDGVVL